VGWTRSRQASKPATTPTAELKRRVGARVDARARAWERGARGVYGLRNACSSSNLSSIELERAVADGIACLGRRRACADSQDDRRCSDARWEAMGDALRHGTVRYGTKRGAGLTLTLRTQVGRLRGLQGVFSLHDIATSSFVNGVCSCKIASEMPGQRSFQRLASLPRLTSEGLRGSVCVNVGGEAWKGNGLEGRVSELSTVRLRISHSTSLGCANVE
jgi:hypothetical protein